MNGEHHDMTDAIGTNRYTRRQALQFAAGGVAALSLSGLLGACGSGSSSQTTASPAASGSPKRGGILRAGISGGGSGDHLDPQNPLSNTDYARMFQLYDPLMRLGSTGAYEMILAEEVTPNAKATEWTIRIRPNVKTHDGRDFGAKDVLYSFNRIVKNKYPGSLATGPLNLAQSRVLDERTVLLAYDQPFAILKDSLVSHFFHQVPEGFDPKNPVGTGPFKLKSFTPGESSEVTRFEDYWGSPLPYLDGVVTTNVADESAQVNGLQSGQLDVINLLSYPSVQAVTGSGVNVIISEGGGWLPFTMRCDVAPFDDVRVRQALRLATNRQQYLDQVYGGYGQLGNDVMIGAFHPSYDTRIPQREQDIEQAKSLLKQAGQENLVVTLVTTSVAPAEVQLAQLLKEQVAAAGITVNIQKKTVTDYFATEYMKAAFSQDWWAYGPYLYLASVATISGAPFNAAHMADEEYDSLFKQGSQTLDAALQQEICHEMQRIEYERGGFIVPFFNPQIDAASPQVRGISKSVSGQSLDFWNWRKFWVS